MTLAGGQLRRVHFAPKLCMGAWTVRCTSKQRCWRPSAPVWRPNQSRCTMRAAAGPATVAVSNNTASMLLAGGIFLVGGALALLALSAIPLLLEMRRTAQQLERTAAALEREIPGTAATMRLTGLELSDAIQEVSLLSADVTRGIQASARSIQVMEAGARQAADFVQVAAKTRVLPALRKRIPPARGRLEERLLETGGLSYEAPNLLELATNTKLIARRIRIAVAASTLFNQASAVANVLLSRNPPQSSAS